MRPTDVPPPNCPEFAGVRAQLALAFVEHEADLGPATEAASDQAILDRVDDIMALLLGGVANATAQRDEAWLSRYAWFVDLVEGIASGEVGKPLDG